MGTKGFQKGHTVSEETKIKISKANDGNFFAKCDYCGESYHTKKSAFERRKRHFCSRVCYSRYRSELLPKEEQNAFGTGHTEEERNKRKKAREIFRQPPAFCSLNFIYLYYQFFLKPCIRSIIESAVPKPKKQ